MGKRAETLLSLIVIGQQHWPVDRQVILFNADSRRL